MATEPDIPGGNLAELRRRVRELEARQLGSERNQQASAELAAVVNNVTTGLMMLNRDMTVSWANPLLASRFGMTPEEMVGRVWYDLAPPMRSREQLYQRVFQGESLDFPSAEVEFPEGKRYFKVRYLPVAHNGEAISGMLVIAEEVTERKLAEQRLQETEDRIRESSRLASVGQLAAGVAHEINNPLAIILGYAELLLEGNLQSTDRSNLELIHSETQRIAGIVHNLLSFARQGSARQAPVDVVAVISQVVEMKVRELTVHDINVTVDLPEGLPPIAGDDQQLVEVLLNIIANAQYELTEAKGRGELVIRASHLGDRVRISIIDDGPGIPRENLGRIFDPFFTTKDVGKGTGLGLSICHGIVSQHGGNLWAESPPGQGAAFHLELPLSRWAGEAPEPVSEEEAPRPSLLQKRVLVVDDEPGIRSLVYEALSPWGCSVDLVTDGAAAWQALQQNSYDCIFIDLNMPGTSGQQLYRLISERDGDLARRCVFLTGATFTPETRDFVSAVGNTILEKPVGLQTLRQVVAGF